MIKANAKTLGLSLGAAQPHEVHCVNAGTIKTPTLILRGERTTAYFQAISSTLERCVPGSQLVVIPGADHLMSARNPSGFNQALLAFLNKHP